MAEPNDSRSGAAHSAATALAVNGGTPVRTAPMPGRLAMGEEERAAVLAVLDFYRAAGEDPPYQGHFEQAYCGAFAAAQGGGYADAVATGTAAVYVALAALDLPPGAEVLVSPISDPGTYAAIILNRLLPRLMDALPGQYGIGAESVLSGLTPRTRAVLAVHSCGRAIADIALIAEICRERGIPLVEDCSQAHGAGVGGRRVGCFGAIAAFSTMYRKAHITGGSGGVVYSTDLDLHRLALARADRGKAPWLPGFDDRDPNQFLFPALNLHNDEISCGIGLASLRRLEETNARRLAHARDMAAALADGSAACSLRPFAAGDAPFILPVSVVLERLRCSKREFALALRAEGIGLNPHYQYLAADWPWLRPYLAKGGDTPEARQSLDASFVLYVNENYTAQETADTVAAVRKVERALMR